ncbi:MAG: protein kinase [Isosphaeraceae bacterium]
MIGRLAPSFSLECARAGSAGSPPVRGRVALEDYGGRWLILMFYPHDFSMVCPTELLGLSRRAQQFHEQGCDLLGVSCDPLESHLDWLRTPEERGGVSTLAFPLASDPDGNVARTYRVFLEAQKVALRGLFIIDPNGVLQYQAVHNLSVGRRTDDILRILNAIQSGGTCGERWESPSDTIDPIRLLVPGFRLGPFEILDSLGSGTFATVFRARDTALDRPVALKVFRSEVGRNAEAILAEARAVAALNHPNICTVFGVVETLGTPIIAMEYVEGRLLSALMGGSALPPQRVALLVRQVADGMAAAHERGIIHGDLKPENVMVGPEDRVKLLDFGLARRRSVRHSGDETVVLGPADRADSGGLFGTPSYLAPEQARGGHSSEATDVFAVGLLIHEMLTGRRAFGGGDLLETLDRIREGDPLELAHDVTPPFDALLERALQPDPTRRKITMSEIAEALRGQAEYPLSPS